MDKIYEHQRIADTKSTEEQQAFAANFFDQTLHSLEQRHIGKRRAVRCAVYEILQPDLTLAGAIETHSALLLLARNREHKIRLVSTNFDRLFEEAENNLPHYDAPMLPVPNENQWNGLVYLHGRLPELANEETALNQLVLTSGDFGRAYMYDGWAARFVSALFRNYTVCFIGYSVNDPIMRYMVDALAAAQMMGEKPTATYAFTSSSDFADKSDKAIITPIFYDNANKHFALHQTLKKWAEIYRDGKESIIDEYALRNPAESTPQDDFVGRMLWALSDQSGVPARKFAEFNPAPPLAWLEKFSQDNWFFQHITSYLSQTGYRLCLVSWLMRYLNAPNVFIWIAQNRARLIAVSPSFIFNLTHELDRLANLQQAGKTDELDAIRRNSPAGIPDLQMEKLWRLLLAGRVKLPDENTALYHWRDRFKRDGLTSALRFELRDLLTPKICVRASFSWQSTVTGGEAVGGEVKLTAEYVDFLGKEITALLRQKEALPLLLDDFQQLLRDAMELWRELGDAEYRRDRATLDLPSINPHSQNCHSRDWTLLIKLTRDAWLAVSEKEPQRAVQIARNWFVLPYPIFKRLALFAAGQDGCIASDEWVDWLLVDEAWWLWASETKREVCRLLVLQGKNLTQAAQIQLENTILANPPRKVFNNDDASVYLADYYVWLRLAKLQASGVELGKDAAAKIVAISQSNPRRQLVADESDEFCSWIGDVTEYQPDFKNQTPRKFAELAEWLKTPMPQDEYHLYDALYDWRKICRRYAAVGFALSEIAKDGFWAAEQWNDALCTWAINKTLCCRSWKRFAPVLAKVPDDIMPKLAGGLARWLQTAAKTSDLHEDILLTMSERLLRLFADTDEPQKVKNDLINDAINQPVGRVTEALILLWLKNKPRLGEPIPEKIKLLFTLICVPKYPSLRHGRLLLAQYLTALFHSNQDWTETNFLPFFAWDNMEAAAVWSGFLLSGQWSEQFFSAFKLRFFATSKHLDQLEKSVRPRYAAYLTNVALAHLNDDQTGEFRAEAEKTAARRFRQCRVGAFYRA